MRFRDKPVELLDYIAVKEGTPKLPERERAIFVESLAKLRT